MRNVRRWGRWTVVLLAAAGVAAAYVRRDEVLARVPYRWNPWAPLALAQPPDRFTRFRLDRIRQDPAALPAAAPAGTAAVSAGGTTGDAAVAHFLREVRDGACRYFDAVLGPEYNAAHRDHFHFDRGPYRVCR